MSTEYSHPSLSPDQLPLDELEQIIHLAEVHLKAEAKEGLAVSADEDRIDPDRLAEMKAVLKRRKSGGH